MPHVPQPGVSIHKKSKTFKGFTVFAPTRSKFAFLINMAGDTVHRWEINEGAINHALLLENGNLFIGERGPEDSPIAMARGGRIREYDWDSNVV